MFSPLSFTIFHQQKNYYFRCAQQNVSFVPVHEGITYRFHMVRSTSQSSQSNGPLTSGTSVIMQISDKINIVPIYFCTRCTSPPSPKNLLLRRSKDRVNVACSPGQSSTWQFSAGNGQENIRYWFFHFPLNSASLLDCRQQLIIRTSCARQFNKSRSVKAVAARFVAISLFCDTMHCTKRQIGRKLPTREKGAKGDRCSSTTAIYRMKMLLVRFTCCTDTILFIWSTVNI